MAHDVFISYAAGDKSVADAVCAALERRQVRCWIAPRDARPGLDYADSIADALDETSVMVFVVSSKSIVSPHVKREVEHAADRGTHVIPFRIEDVGLSRGLRFFLGTVHWIDALTPPIDKPLDQLSETVQYFLDRKLASEATGQVVPAAPGEPAPRSVVPPIVPPRDAAVPPAGVEAPPVAGVAAAPPSAAPAPTPAAQTVAPAAARAESPARQAAPTVTPTEPASSPSARTASTSPPASPAVRNGLPKGDEASRGGPSEGIVASRGAAVGAPSGPRPQGSAVAASGEGSTLEEPSALRPEPKNLLWLVVGFGTVGAALGELFAFGILRSIFGSDSILYEGVPAWTFRTIVPAVVVIWAWLATVQHRILPPAVAGGIAGMFGGWLRVASFWVPSRLATLPAQTLQWAAFGVAGGLAAGRGGKARAAMSVSIALVCVSFVRTLYFVLQPAGYFQFGVFDLPIAAGAFQYLLFDLSIAIGWGVGLIACPATTAALRPREAPSPR